MTRSFSCAMLVALLCVGVHVAEARLGNPTGAQAVTESTFNAFVESNEKVLVDFYDPKDPNWREGEDELIQAVKNLGRIGSKVPIAKVDVSKETALTKKFVPDGKYPQLMWFLHGQPTQYHRTLRTSKAITDFVVALDRPAMVALKKEEEALDYVPSVFARVAKNTAAFRTLEVVAQKHMDTVAFTFLEGPSNEVSWFGGSDPGKYGGDMDVAAIEKWVQKQLVKSEPIPEDPSLLEDEGSKVVVGKSFEDIVLQKDKDVIMQVYASWCGHCKKFTPIWKSFAQEVSEVAHLVVAKMDGSLNGSPLPEDFSWDSYPKVFMVPAGQRKPIHFTGDRTVKNLINFVSTHSSKRVDSRSGSEEAILDL